MTSRRMLGMAVAIGLSLMGAGVFGGIAVERVRHGPERAAMLERYEHEVREWGERTARLADHASFRRDVPEHPRGDSRP
jgi:hypothetical protein